LFLSVLGAVVKDVSTHTVSTADIKETKRKKKNRRCAMSRPKKSIRTKRNGDYIQVVEEGAVITSLRPDLLCQVAKIKKRVGTKRLMAQLDYINGGLKKGGSGTNHE